MKHVRLAEYFSGLVGARYPWRNGRPTFDDISVRADLIAKRNEIPGAAFTARLDRKAARRAPERAETSLRR